MEKNSESDPSHRSISKLYKDYKSRGLLSYVGRSILTIILLYSLFMVLVILVDRYLIDFSSLFGTLIERLDNTFVILLFFLSESFLGLVVVDLFVVWTQQFENPLPYLALLGLLSYSGSIISYGIGRWIAGRPRIRSYSERNLKKYMDFCRKWGAAFIIIAALFPFTPFSMVVIALALLNYPFRLFLLFALSRLLRFVIQGLLMFDILQLQNWMI